MAPRLGNFLLGASIFIAVGWFWLNDTFGQPDMGPVYITAAIIVVVGIVVRHVLAGRKDKA